MGVNYNSYVHLLNIYMAEKGISDADLRLYLTAMHSCIPRKIRNSLWHI